MIVLYYILIIEIVKVLEVVWDPKGSIFLQSGHCNVINGRQVSFLPIIYSIFTPPFFLKGTQVG